MAEETYSDDPSTPSYAYQCMYPHWCRVNDILCGAEAMRASGTEMKPVSGPAVPYANLSQLNRGNGGSESPYLPRFPNESYQDYECRRRHAPFTNIYSDISRFLASKPFTKPAGLADTEPQDLQDLSEDIDGRGNNFNVFSHRVFKGGLDKGVHYILVDYTNIPPGASLAQERALNARPYWVSLPAERVLAGYSTFLRGEEVITNVRIDEATTEVHGYGEEHVRRVREFYRDPVVDAAGTVIDYLPAAWRLWELVKEEEVAGGQATKETWVEVDAGEVTIGIIPLVRYYTGEHDGWRVDPPLKDIALMQIEEFQQESNLKTIKELTAFPMLAGNGVDPPTEDGQKIQVPVGPRAVLFAPPGADGKNGTWNILEPNASSLTFLQTSLDKFRTEMRDLGMQPLNQVNQTVVNTANLSIKAHSQIQALALMLEDALELAWHYTCLWLKRPTEFPDVNVYTDFGVDMTAQLELPMLLQAQAQNVISKATVQDEFKRRGVLSDNFDPVAEEQQLAEEQAQASLLTPEAPIDPRTGKAVQNATASMTPMATSAMANDMQPNNTRVN